MAYIGNSPAQGIISGANIQDGSIDTSDLKDNAVTAAKMAATLDLSAKTVTLPPGVGQPEAGSTANRPANPAIGTLYFDTDLDVLINYTAQGWLKVSIEIPIINSISGNIYAGLGSTLSLVGTGFGTTQGTVTFTSGATTASVNVTPSTQTSLSVAVPASIYGLANGTTVTITFTNGDGGGSSPFQKSVQALPTGGTITTSGNDRIHTFTSSGSFVVPSGFSATAQYLIVAGGGGGATDSDVGGGGGAGGLITGNINVTAQTYSVVVGAGGAGGTSSYTPGTGAGGNGAQGGNSSLFGYTAIGGGHGGTRNTNGGNGGSGGGGGDQNTGGAYGGAGTSGQGYSGGQGLPFNSNGGNDQGAGGGAGGAASGAVAGPGFVSSITGTAVTYAAGGRGMGPSTAAINTGNGGRGSATSTDSQGGSGIVIIRYPFPS